jgi:hypothetical protein
VLLAAKLRCGGKSLSVSLLPPTVSPPLASFTLDMPARYEPGVLESILYTPPYLSIAAPPPEAFSA